MCQYKKYYVFYLYKYLNNDLNFSVDRSSFSVRFACWGELFIFASSLALIEPNEKF